MQCSVSLPLVPLRWPHLLPGGTGSYHVLVPQGLFFLYHIPLNDAVAFTFIFHGWQTAIFIIFGALSLVITSLSCKKEVW